MSVGRALKLTCVGIAGGIILRVINMLYFFDYATGFYTDGGILAWASIGLVLAASAVAIAMCLKDKRSYEAFTARKNIFQGVVSLASGLLLLVVAFLQLREHQSHIQLGYIGRNYAQSSTLHIIFIVTSALFGALQIFTAVTFFSGKNLFLKCRPLYLVSVLWGISYLLFVFVYYAKSSSLVENMNTILSSVAMMLTLLYISKLFAGIGGGKSAKRCFIVGIPASIITLAYTVSNLVLVLFNKTYVYYGEIPVVIQLAGLSVSLFILMFLFTYKKYGMKRKPAPRPGSRAAQEKGAQRYKD